MPMLRIHIPDKGIEAKAPTERWLAALIEALRHRPTDSHSPLLLAKGSTRELGVELGGDTVRHPAATWLTWLLRHLSPREREDVDHFMRSDVVLHTGEAQELSILMPLAVTETKGSLEEWISAVLHALPSAPREAVFEAVHRSIPYETPGHRVMHAELPPELGGD